MKKSNAIRIGNLRVESGDATIKELHKVVDKILRKHKKVVSKEAIPEENYIEQMYG